MRLCPLLVAAAALPACYSPSFAPCGVTCATTQACPDGLSCVGGICVAPGETCGPLDDAAPDMAKPLGMWGTARKVEFDPPPIGSYDDPSLTPDMLTIYVNRNGGDVMTASRPVTFEPFGTLVAVPALATDASEGGADVSSTDDVIVLAIRDDVTDYDIFYSIRDNAGGYGAPEKILALSSPVTDGSPSLSQDQKTLVFHSERIGSSSGDLYMTTRDDISVWNLDVATSSLFVKVNSPSYEHGPFLSADQLTIYFASDRAGSQDLYMATRQTRDDPFDAPVPITELNTPDHETDPWVSPDGQFIYFARGVPNNFQIYFAERI